MSLPWKFWIKSVFIVLVAGVLGSCAPTYETRYELTPPKTTAGLQCLKTCEVKAQQCNTSCAQRYSACSAKAEQQAKLEMPKYQQQYEVALAVWRERYSQYLQDKMFYDMRRDQARAMRDACEIVKGDRHECPRMGPHWSDRPDEPEDKPVAPTLAGVTKAIRDATCQSDCQCDNQYRTCYSSCGGGVKPQQFCVRNCN